MCDETAETIHHLFVDCGIAADLWSKIAARWVDKGLNQGFDVMGSEMVMGFVEVFVFDFGSKMVMAFVEVFVFGLG